MRWGSYVRRVTGGASQVAIEARTGISQGTISRWLEGKVLPQPAQAAKLAQSYGGNVLEAFVAAGFLSEEQAGLPPRPTTSFDRLIDDDPHLSAEAKVHIKNQYGLLKAASLASRTTALRRQIESNATLDAETKAQLLATLDGPSDDNMLISDLRDRRAMPDWLDEDAVVATKAARAPGRPGSNAEPED